MNCLINTSKLSYDHNNGVGVHVHEDDHLHRSSFLSDSPLNILLLLFHFCSSVSAIPCFNCVLATGGSRGETFCSHTLFCSVKAQTI